MIIFDDDTDSKLSQAFWKALRELSDEVVRSEAIPVLASTKTATSLIKYFSLENAEFPLAVIDFEVTKKREMLPNVTPETAIEFFKHHLGMDEPAPTPSAASSDESIEEHDEL